MAVDLATTNTLLGIVAAVTVLEALALIGLFLGGCLLYRRMRQVMTKIEERHVAPTVTRVNAILDDVKDVTSVVKDAAEGVDAGARGGLAWLLGRFRAGRRAA